MKEILDKIKEYKNIVIYRHVNGDYDAFGSQLGMYDLITNTFKDKKVYLAGDFRGDLIDKFKFNDTIVEPIYDKSTLGIVVDTANKERIDGDYSKCDFIIKIDHHIVVDDFGQINYADPTASSASQLVVKFYKENEKDLLLTQSAARNLYMGIIGDTSRFLFKNTDYRTFEAASILVHTGIDITELYNEMYLRDAKELDINKFILNNYVVNGKIAYYVLTTEDLKELGISRERGSDFVNLLSQIREYYVWVAITENAEDHNYRVSIRSRDYTINKVAEKYHGGGHALASGATLDNLNQLNDLLNDLNTVIENKG